MGKEHRHPGKMCLPVVYTCCKSQKTKQGNPIWVQLRAGILHSEQMLRSWRAGSSETGKGQRKGELNVTLLTLIVKFRFMKVV
jgi:hypothetical protein